MNFQELTDGISDVIRNIQEKLEPKPHITMSMVVDPDGDVYISIHAEWLNLLGDNGVALYKRNFTRPELEEYGEDFEQILGDSIEWALVEIRNMHEAEKREEEAQTNIHTENRSPDHSRLNMFETLEWFDVLGDDRNGHKH